MTKIPGKTCLKSLQFALSFCKLCLIFGLWLWHCTLAHQLEEFWGQFSGNLTLFFGDYICYISEFATILEFAVQTLEMTYISEMSAMKLWKCEWDYENVNETMKMWTKYRCWYSLYRKVKGNMSMIICSYWYNLYLCIYKYVCSTVWTMNDAVFGVWCHSIILLYL